MKQPRTVQAAAAYILRLYTTMDPEQRVHWAANCNVSITRLAEVVSLCRVLSEGKSHKQYAQAEARLRALSPRLWQSLRA